MAELHKDVNNLHSRTKLQELQEGMATYESNQLLAESPWDKETREDNLKPPNSVLLF